MEQRPLRLGDIVDDYCPRERRVTNHAIVALVGDDIKQTRCSACDAEHPYKPQRATRRKKSEHAELYDQVLANAGPGQLVARSENGADHADRDASPPLAADAAASKNGAQPADVDASVETEGTDDQGRWLAHRQLIRATLPRPDVPPPASRPLPDFTIRQQHGRNRFRDNGRPRHGDGGWNDSDGQPPSNESRPIVFDNARGGRGGRRPHGGHAGPGGHGGHGGHGPGHGAGHGHGHAHGGPGQGQGQGGGHGRRRRRRR